MVRVRTCQGARQGSPDCPQSSCTAQIQHALGERVGVCSVPTVGPLRGQQREACTCTARTMGGGGWANVGTGRACVAEVAVG